MGKRENFVFGVHFDYHAHADERNLCADADPAGIEDFLTRVKPDYVQVDTKGHPGISTYPTKVGRRGDLAPDFDYLRMWRELTAKHGVALYAHHSSIYEEAAVEDHPEWAQVNELGEPTHNISIFSRYVVDRFIPQVIEIAVDYGLDGAWLDGDVWAFNLDYSECAAAAYLKATGKPLPRSGDPDFGEYVSFLRDCYRKYVTFYCDKIHEAAPDFEICVAGLHGLYCPSSTALPVDFVSHDVNGPHPRLVSRLFMKAGKPWDTMAWTGTLLPGQSCIADVVNRYCTEKTAETLEQEAAVSLALGGGTESCNVGLARIKNWMTPIYAEVSRFAHDRKPYCFGAKPVHQAAVFFSHEKYLSLPPDPNGLWREGGYETGVAAMVNLIQFNGFSSEIVFADDAPDFGEYGLIILPNADKIEPEAKAALLRYAENGGNLLLTGPDTVALFADELGLTVSPAPEGLTACVLFEDRPVALPSRYCEVSGDFRTDYKYYANDFLDGEPHPAALRVGYGKGQIECVPIDFSASWDYTVSGMRRFLGAVAHSLWTDPMVEISGSAYAEVTLMRKDGVLSVNIINAGGGGYAALSGCKILQPDEIPPLRDITVALRLPEKPNAVTLEPEHKPLPFTYEDGVARFTVDKMAIHGVVTVK